LQWAQPDQPHALKTHPPEGDPTIGFQAA
jgi:hypothetical protein